MPMIQSSFFNCWCFLKVLKKVLSFKDVLKKQRKNITNQNKWINVFLAETEVREKLKKDTSKQT